MSSNTTDVELYDWAQEPADGDASGDAETVPVASPPGTGQPVDPPDRETPPVYATVTGRDATSRRPVVPAWARSRTDAVASLRFAAGGVAYTGAYHVTRLPKYVAKAVLWAPVGLGRVLAAAWRWVFDVEAGAVGRDAVAQHDINGYHRVVADRDRHVKHRLWAAVLALAVAGVGLLLVATLAPWWLRLVLAVLLLAVLARAGRPADRALVDTVVNAPKYRKLTAEAVRQALTSLGISAMKQPKSISFPREISRDGPGYLASVDLPHGVTAAEVIDRRSKLASALRVPVDQCWPESVAGQHAGRLDLWVADEPVSAMRQPAWPLAKSGTVDVFRPFPFGTDPRKRPVQAGLIYRNWLIGAMPGAGKALALDTPVPTPSGWTTMGELQAGDEVFDEQGNRCRVVTAWPVHHGRPCYEVEFSDGTVIIADADHLWLVDTRASRLSDYYQRKPHKRESPYSNDQRHKRTLPKVVTTADMLGSARLEADRRANYSVRVAGPLQGDDVDLPVPPYTLGAWLGDGDNRGGKITTPDLDVLAEISAECECPWLVASSIDENCAGFRIEDLTRRLRGLGLLHNKHIPVAYLRASEDQRRALLAGLLDTDGYCTPRGSVVFAVSRERLARDVRHLAASLGYKATLNSKPARFEGRDYGLQWIVSFTPPDKVFRLPRKADRQITNVRASAEHRYITGIRPVASVPVRCITVDSPSSLYLVSEACIPTHNTGTLRLLLLAASLDARVELRGYELKGSGDLDMLEPVCAEYGSGPDDDTADQALGMLRWARQECGRRAEAIKRMASAGKAPENKVTPELAAMPGVGLHPVVCFVDEVQELMGHERYGAEAGTLATQVIKLGRALGVILLLATQRPDKDSLPTGVSANVNTRFCLRVMGQIENDLVLGTSMYRNGVRSTQWTDRDLGWGWLVGVGEPAPVHTHWLDVDQARRVVARAVALRGGPVQHAEQPAAVRYDLLADCSACWPEGQDAAWSGQLVGRLAQLRPDAYAGWEVGTLNGALRAAGVTPRQIHRKADGKGVTRYGVHWADLDTSRPADS